MKHNKAPSTAAPSHDLDPYEKLANAIIIMAVKDYRHALKKHRINPNSDAVNRDIEKLEEFFRSDWYCKLTTVDGEMIIRKIREEVNGT